MPSPSLAPSRVQAIRAFNRFYTRRIGVLSEGLLESPFSLTESRLLWELAHCEHTTAAELAQTLQIDAGYLSRLLRSFKDRGFIKSTRSKSDGRQLQLSLTAAGRRAFAPLDMRSQEEISALISALTEAQQAQLLQSMSSIEQLLSDAPRRQAPCLLRPHRPGDMGWIVARHGALYAQEHQLDARFEALVARIAADFIERFDPRREACWIAERDGVNVASVALVQVRDEHTQAPIQGVAQLRLLLVEPSARGLGLGQRLVAECEHFARRAGYDKIMLWTTSQLDTARGIYQKAGYRLIRSEPDNSFGQALVGEVWELPLTTIQGAAA
jgi:DNA-binding MarR family transcriptional regulator/GNAT superfamily N-acetyltransferase